MLLINYLKILIKSFKDCNNLEKIEIIFKKFLPQTSFCRFNGKTEPKNFAPKLTSSDWSRMF